MPAADRLVGDHDPSALQAHAQRERPTSHPVTPRVVWSSLPSTSGRPDGSGGACNPSMNPDGKRAPLRMSSWIKVGQPC